MALDKLTPSDAAFWKLAFANLCTGKIICHDYQAVKHSYPTLTKIIEKLTPEELKYLTEKIESSM
jgi:hypothetical protein